MWANSDECFKDHRFSSEYENRLRDVLTDMFRVCACADPTFAEKLPTGPQKEQIQAELRISFNRCPLV
jgi:hypothetical protein